MVWRKDFNQLTGIKEVQHLKDKIRIIKEHIVDRNKEIRGIKVKKIAEQVRSNVNNRTKKGSNETSYQKWGRRNTEAPGKIKKE